MQCMSNSRTFSSKTFRDMTRCTLPDVFVSNGLADLTRLVGPRMLPEPAIYYDLLHYAEFRKILVFP